MRCHVGGIQEWEVSVVHVWVQKPHRHVIISVKEGVVNVRASTSLHNLADMFLGAVGVVVLAFSDFTLYPLFIDCINV